MPIRKSRSATPSLKGSRQNPTTAASDESPPLADGFKLARLRPYNQGAGLTLRSYTLRGVKFQHDRGWYIVSDDIAAKLKTVKPSEYAPLAFDVCASYDEAMQIEENESRAGRGSPSRPISTFGATNTEGTVARTNAQMAAGYRSIDKTRREGGGAEPAVDTSRRFDRSMRPL